MGGSQGSEQINNYVEKFMKSDNELLKLMQCIKKKGKCTRKNT